MAGEGKAKVSLWACAFPLLILSRVSHFYNLFFFAVTSLSGGEDDEPPHAFAIGAVALRGGGSLRLARRTGKIHRKMGKVTGLVFRARMVRIILYQ